MFFEGKDLPISMLFVKCGCLKGESVHKSILAAAALGFAFRSR